MHVYKDKQTGLLPCVPCDRCDQPLVLGHLRVVTSSSDHLICSHSSSVLASPISVATSKLLLSLRQWI